MHKQKLKIVVLALAGVFCLFAAEPVRAMHGIDPLRLSDESGDLGGSVGPHFGRPSESNEPKRELLPEPSKGDLGYGSQGGSPRSELPTYYDSYDLKHRAYRPDQRLSFKSPADGDLGGGHAEPVQADEKRPALTVDDRNAILHIARDRAPRILFDKGGNVLARDDVKTSLTPEQKAFYRTIITKMKEQREQYSSQELTSDQRAVERYCIEAINDGLVELHALEGSGAGSEKITEMQENIKAMIGQMTEVIGGLPAEEEHRLAAEFEGDISTQKPDEGAFFAQVETDFSRALEESRPLIEPAGPETEELQEEREQMHQNDTQIDTFLKELGWNRLDLEGLNGKKITKDLRTALRKIRDMTDLAVASKRPMGKFEIQTILHAQETALTELQIFVAKQRIRRAVGDAAEEVGKLEDLIPQVRGMLKGKDKVLAEFKRSTAYYLTEIKKAQKNLASQSTYFTDFAAFEEEFAAKKKVLEDAIEDLRTYLNNIGVVKPHVEPIKPVVVEVPQKSQPVRTVPPVVHEEVSEAPAVTEEQRVEQFLTSGTGAELLDAQIQSAGFSGVTVEASRSAAMAFLQEDPEFTQLVNSLQKLEAQKGTKSRTLGDLFGDGDKQSQKLNKQIAQQKAAVEKRIAAVLTQVQKVQGLLAETPSGKGYGTVSLELGKEQRLWRTRLSSARKNDIALALSLVTILETQALKAEQDTALKKLSEWENDAQEAKSSFEQTNLKQITVQELREYQEEVQKQLQKVDQLRNLLPSFGDVFERRQALISQLEAFQKVIQGELVRREQPFVDALNETEETLQAANRMLLFSQELKPRQPFPRKLVAGFNKEIGASLERLIRLDIPAEYPHLEKKRLDLIKNLQEEQADYLRIFNSHFSADSKGDEGNDTVAAGDEDEKDDVLYGRDELDLHYKKRAATMEKNNTRITQLAKELELRLEKCVVETDDGVRVLEYEKLPEDIQKIISKSDYTPLMLKLQVLSASGTDDMFIIRQNELIDQLESIIAARKKVVKPLTSNESSEA